MRASGAATEVALAAVRAEGKLVLHIWHQKKDLLYKILLSLLLLFLLSCVQLNSIDYKGINVCRLSLSPDQLPCLR